MEQIISVIARYNEDLSWIKNKLNIPFIIYNKGKDNINYPYVALENIGREGNTYLYHIINHYDNLTAYTMFLQGNPFDHVKELPNSAKIGFTSLNTSKCTCYLDGSPHHPGLNLRLGFELIERPIVNPINFKMSAMFVVDRNTILKNSLDYYKKLYEFTKNSALHPDHILERLWQFIL